MLDRQIERQTGRIEFVDTTKGIGILLVILGHLVTLGGLTSTFIYGFHMPLFFLISGIFASPDKYSFKNYLLKNIKRLLMPYVIYFFIGTIVSLSIPSWRVFNWKELLSAFLRADLSIVHVGAAWFLVCLFEVVILFYPLYHLVIKRMDFSLIIVLVTFLGVGAYYIPLVCNKLSISLHFEFFDVAIMALFFYSVGFVLRNHLQKLNNNPLPWNRLIVWFIALLLLYVLIIRENGFVGMVNGSYGNSAFLFILSAFCGVAFTIIIGFFTRKSKLLSFIGKNSLMIFALHFIFIDLYSLILTNIFGKEIVSQRNLDIIQLIVGFLVVCICTIGIVLVINLIKNKINKKKKLVLE